MNRFVSVVVCGSLLGFCGCNTSAPVEPTAHGTAETSATPVEATSAQPPLGAMYEPVVQQAEKALLDKNPDKAHGLLDELAAVPAQLNPEQTKYLAVLQDEYRRQAAAALVVRQQELLEQANGQIVVGQLTEAEQALARIDPTTLAPPLMEKLTAVQANLAAAQERQKALLLAANQLLQDDAEVAHAAAQRLWEEPRAAAKLLVQQLAELPPDRDPTVWLVFLRKLQDGEISLPGLVHYLQQPDRAAWWPVAARELAELPFPAAQETLLKMALSAPDAKQRGVALTALAEHPIPLPNRLALQLASQLEPASPTFIPALHAAAQSVRQHRLANLVKQPTWETKVEPPLSPEEKLQFQALGKNLTAWLAEPPPAEITPEMQLAVRDLGNAFQLTSLPALPVKVLAVCSETPEFPVAGLTDGQWNSTEPKTMWWGTAGDDRNAWVLLDLGKVQTVTGVRLWSYNHPSKAANGWRYVRILAGDQPAMLRPAGDAADITKAPGKAPTDDYGTTINVPGVRARYLRLDCIRTNDDKPYGGLSEIQVQGF